MITSTTQAHIHFMHSSDEVKDLAEAIVPLHDNILAVSSSWERQGMRHILRGDYFRRKEALAMKSMLIRAVKHARANLGDYFPMMRHEILVSAQRLEDAVVAYWANFAKASLESTPAH